MTSRIDFETFQENWAAAEAAGDADGAGRSQWRDALAHEIVATCLEARTDIDHADTVHWLADLIGDIRNA